MPLTRDYLIDWERATACRLDGGQSAADYPRLIQAVLCDTPTVPHYTGGGTTPSPSLTKALSCGPWKRTRPASRRLPGAEDLRTASEPPHNFEAEQALLGAILVNNAAYQRVAEFLRPEHFADALHGSCSLAVTS